MSSVRRSSLRRSHLPLCPSRGPFSLLCVEQQRQGACMHVCVYLCMDDIMMNVGEAYHFLNFVVYMLFCTHRTRQ